MKKNDYRQFLFRLKSEIIHARHKAYRTVNRQLVELYLNMGGRIYEKIEISRWGQGVVERLAQDLQKEFPDMKGLSKENLWRMKKLYESYKSYPKLSPLVTELSWSHNLVILFRAKSIDEKEFYLKACIHEQWPRRELERQINASLYERFMLSGNTDNLIPDSEKNKPINHFEDKYIFDFLGVQDGFAESNIVLRPQNVTLCS